MVRIGESIFEKDYEKYCILEVGILLKLSSRSHRGFERNNIFYIDETIKIKKY